MDENFLDNLKDEELENELEQILDRNDKFHQLFVKIDTCLNSQQKEIHKAIQNLSINSSNESMNRQL